MRTSSRQHELSLERLFAPARRLLLGDTVIPAYFARRLRRQAIARERAWFSRELHDRVVQSLIALEIKVAVLSRRSAAQAISPELQELRTALQAEIADVRDLMQNLRPLRLEGADVPSFIEEMVRRFEATTGIEARFECELHTVELLPRSCGELARLVQEALANVRKHSGATKVAVSLTRAPNSLVLTVHDNGRGFDFAGRVAAHTLRPHERPRMIEERARAIGASFSIESIPGSGARLDVTCPYAS
jgi:signal transduction histidine kinase